MEKLIEIVGEGHQCGTYCLFFTLTEDIDLSFGKFRKGKVFSLPSGDYIYIGSALATRGSASLGNRTRRHCARTPPLPQHEIRKKLTEKYREEGIKFTSSPAPKKLFWNIDHILNKMEASIFRILLVRSPLKLENKISQQFLQNGVTEVIVSGLGANDAPGDTHVQRIKDIRDTWWKNIPTYIKQILEKSLLEEQQ